MKGSSRTISRNYSNYSDNAEIPVEFLKTGKQKEKAAAPFLRMMQARPEIRISPTNLMCLHVNNDCFTR